MLDCRFCKFVEYIYFGSNFSNNFAEPFVLPSLLYPLEGYMEKDNIFYDVFGCVSFSNAVTTAVSENVRALPQTVGFFAWCFLNCQNISL